LTDLWLLNFFQLFPRCQWQDGTVSAEFLTRQTVFPRGHRHSENHCDVIDTAVVRSFSDISENEKYYVKWRCLMEVVKKTKCWKFPHTVPLKSLLTNTHIEFHIIYYRASLCWWKFSLCPQCRVDQPSMPRRPIVFPKWSDLFLSIEETLQECLVVVALPINIFRYIHCNFLIRQMNVLVHYSDSVGGGGMPRARPYQTHANNGFFKGRVQRMVHCEIVHCERMKRFY
jgi:hypothetical protein